MRPSNYREQLREKQKVKRIYGVLEKQFFLYFERADRMRGVTGENLLGILEKRLDNMVYRLGMASSRSEARQLVRHNHFRVNGHKANIPSMQLGEGDVIEVKEGSRKLKCIMTALEASSRQLSWLELDKAKFKGVIRGEPIREELTLPIDEQLIVELYSK